MFGITGFKCQMPHLLRLTLGVALLLGVTGLGSSSNAQTNSFPANANPGAVLRHSQQQQFLQQNTPYLFRPLSEQDVTGPISPESPITIEDGVLPGKERIQGIIVTPDGQTIIGPPEDGTDSR